MKFSHELPALLAGTAIVSALVVVQPLPASALTGEEVNNIAREVTVLIRGKEGHGSGAIVAKNGETYYVLTANHVVAADDEFVIVTADKQTHTLDSKNITAFNGVDLAVVTFSSDRDYAVGTIAKSDTLSEGKPVFISGWPKPGATGQLVRQFTDGRISGFLDQSYQGYQIIYTNVTRAGMSGGPVIDAGGRIVGIHGLGDTEDPEVLQRQGVDSETARGLASLIKPGFNYAIPINTFLQMAPQQGLYLSLQVEDSAAPELGAPYVASAQTDPRDEMNISDVFQTINEGANTIRNVCGLFGGC